MLQHSTSKWQLTLGSGKTGEEDFTSLYKRGRRYIFRAQKILKAFESLKRLMHSSFLFWLLGENVRKFKLGFKNKAINISESEVTRGDRTGFSLSHFVLLKKVRHRVLK